jgi:DNA-binding CsgD family transcriptional regulator
MKKETWLRWGISVGLVGIGLMSLVLTLVYKINLGISWPLALILLGVVIFLFRTSLKENAPWTNLLSIPGAVVMVLGFIFLLNVLTGDWQSWAYAWLLLLSAIGCGVILCNHQQRWPEGVTQIAAGLVLAGVLFFVVFGAISGGLFFQVSVPLLLICAGLAFYGFTRKGCSLTYLLHGLQGDESSSAARFQIEKPVNALAEPLTAREVQVLELMDLGLSNTEIAERLTLAPSTVKTHINNLYSKLGVQSRIRAVRQGRDLGIIKSH